MSHQLHVFLECSKCKSRNYRLKRGKEKRKDHLEIKKYCKYCQQHTVHREIK